MEAALTCRQVAEATGLPEEFVRAACHRGPRNHPPPHVRSGAKRPVIRIRLSTFERWFEEEEAIV